MSTNATSEHAPVPDRAEAGAFFPSQHSLSQFTSPKSNLSGAEYPNKYTGKGRVLMVAADERYLPMANGTLFSTGNHPVETLLPMIHMDRAGFAIDVATLSGNPVKFEHWAMPGEDADVRGVYEKYLPAFQKPHKLRDVVEALTCGRASEYLAVFIPGGHGALIGLPFDNAVKDILHWACKNNRLVISLCHGPAALLAAGVDVPASDFPFKGYKMCGFPDALDRQTPALGYMPGHLTWFYGEKLKALGVELLNEGVDGMCHRDRNVITGDSPYAANGIGIMAVKALFEAVGQA